MVAYKVLRSVAKKMQCFEKWDPQQEECVNGDGLAGWSVGLWGSIGERISLLLSVQFRYFTEGFGDSVGGFA